MWDRILKTKQGIKGMSESIDLWFIGYIGIDQRVSTVELPENFSHEAWEALDLLLSDEPSPDFGIESDEQGFYKISLTVSSGFDTPHENEWGFEYAEIEKISQ
jgi:hypothetical protein